MRNYAKQIVAIIMCACMLIGMIPMSAMAANYDFTNAQLDVVTNKQSTLATGVSLDSMTVYDKNGDQVKMFVTTADMSVDTVELFASYKNMDPTNYGMSRLTAQVASFDEKVAAGDEYYRGTVVAGINSSYYNMITGKPTGTFVMNGVDVTTESEGNAYGYFAVMKDGSVKIAGKNQYSKDKGNIQEAIGIYTMLIEDGKICSGLNTVQKYPRQTIGVTADGKVIIMTADGNQAPSSIGLTVLEQAQVMLDLGCVWAGHLDGGGSCTYACRPEGTDTFGVANSPSDGSEREISNGLIIASTEAASKEFARVAYDVESEYVTPGTSVNVAVKGVSTSGSSAEIPAEVTYEIVNGSYANGVFTAGNSTGEATITAIYKGEKVGTTTLNVVIPNSVNFASSEVVVPYGKSTELIIEAKYGVKDVTIKPEDFNFQLSDTTAGSISGFTFAACKEGENASTGTKVTATLVHNQTIVITTDITIGKGSEVVYDFEDNTTQGILFSEPVGTKYNYVWPESDQWVVDKESGQVHSGDKALAMDVNYGNSLESGYMKTSVLSSETRVFENALSIGAWIYIPDEAVGLWARWTLLRVTGYNADGTPIFNGSINSNNMDTTAGGTGIVYTFDEPGWHYLHADVSAYDAVGWKAGGVMMQFYISDRDGTAYNYVAADNSNIPGKFRFYLDDITVDYSTAVDDREAPVFSNVTYATSGMPDAAQINNQTIDTNTVTFAATVKDNTTKSNATGLDISSIKAYVDGVEVEHTYSNNIVTVDVDELTNGKHTIKFSACDKMGNYSSVYKYITVDADNAKSTVKLVPQDATLDRILLGSIYNMDLVATAIEDVKSVEVTIDLDNNSVWQLDHMTVAEGFEATYDIEKTENIATITITRTGENNETGEKAIATLPVRTWELKTGYTYPNGTKQGTAALTCKQFRDMKEFWRMSVIANVDKGVLTRVDDTVGTFTGERVFCDTEMWGNYAKMSGTTEGLAYYNAWNGGHIHTAEAVADLAADCTEAGYTGRTFCQVCNSVVDWGTVVDPTGHTYKNTDGVVKCHCGELLNGEHTDGKTYINGIVAEGWIGESYYVDGVKLTGLQQVNGYYYDFGDDGICENKARLDGFYYNKDAEAYMYMQGGIKTTGDLAINNVPYYFDANGYAYSGTRTIAGYNVNFDEKGTFVPSTDGEVIEAGCVGTNLEFVLLSNGTLKIVGSGAMRDYQVSGIYAPWFYNHMEKVNAVEFGKDVTSIGAYAFNRCEHIKTVTFEDGSQLKSIGYNAFRASHRLQAVKLPASVEVIEELAFYMCGAITSFEFEEGTKLRKIGRQAFSKTMFLEEIAIPASVIEIGDYLFEKGNANITMLVVKDSVAHYYAVNNKIKYELVDGEVPPMYSGKCGDNATWGLYPNGEFVVSGSGAMTNYTSHTEQPWLKYASKITSVVIGKDITAVGNYAFAYCTNVESITFEEGSKLQRVGVLSFMNNAKVTEVVLPKTVTYIGSCAFSDCFELTSINIPYDCTYIHANAFRKDTKVTLTVVEGSYAEQYAINNKIPYEVTEYVYEELASGTCGDNATWVLYTNGEFRVNGTGAMTNYTSHTEQSWRKYASDIKAVVIGKDITAVGNYAFAYCVNVESITFEEGSKLQRVGVLSFMNNAKVTEVVLPKTVTYLGSHAFSDCFELTAINIPYDCTYIHANTFRKDTKVTLTVVEGSYAEQFAINYKIPYEVTEYVYEELASGTCGDNATWVLYTNGEFRVNGTGAMTNYTSHTEQPWRKYAPDIKTIVIGKDITAVGNYAFAYSVNVESITFEEGSKLERVGVLSFMNNAKVTEVVLPETVTYLGSCAFSDCFELTAINIPYDCTYIHANAFRKDTKITLTVVEGSYAEQYAISKNMSYVVTEYVYEELASGTCGDNATWVLYTNGELRINGTGAMTNYTSHTEQPWRNYAPDIKAVVIGKDITAVGNYAFAYCVNVESITFEEGSKLQRVGVLSFMNNAKVTEVVLPETVTYLGSCAFSDCFELTSIEIPAGCTYIHANAFRKDTKVTLTVAAGSFAEQFAIDKGIPYTIK